MTVTRTRPTRKEAADRASSSKLLLENRPKPRNPKKRPIKYTMTTQQLTEIIGELEEIAEIPDDLVTPAEADELGRIITQMAADGRSVIFISHKLQEVLAVTHRRLQRQRLLGGAFADQLLAARLDVVGGVSREPGKHIVEVERRRHRSGPPEAAAATPSSLASGRGRARRW